MSIESALAAFPNISFTLAVGMVPEEIFDAFNDDNDEPSPLKDEALKAPVDELKVKLELLFVCKLPVAAVVINGKQVVSDASFATVTCAADPADNDPAFTHAVSVPSDDKTWPGVPKLSSPSYTFPCSSTSLNTARPE